MARKKPVESDVIFIDELPGINGGTSWTTVLAPLLRHPQRWALVREFKTAQQAINAQSNLHRRKMNIPQPDHEWSFASRGCELYACYRGPIRRKRAHSARVRRA